MQRFRLSDAVSRSPGRPSSTSGSRRRRKKSPCTSWGTPRGTKTPPTRPTPAAIACRVQTNTNPPHFSRRRAAHHTAIIDLTKGGGAPCASGCSPRLDSGSVQSEGGRVRCSPEWRFAVQMNGSLQVPIDNQSAYVLNHARAHMNHTLAHQAAFRQHSIGAPRSIPLVKRCPEFTRERCGGFRRATLVCTRA